MSEEKATRHASGHWLLWLELLALFGLFAFLGWTAGRVVHEGGLQEMHTADAIVVFGAAEYAGHPSPVLRARLDHAFELFQRGIAPVVITTGGSAADPSFSEGGVGHDYLKHRGIPERNLIAETQGSDTAQSAVRVAVIMRANGLHSCVAVSDAYHVFRIRNCWSMRASVRSMLPPGPVLRRAARCNALSRRSGKRPATLCGGWESHESDFLMQIIGASYKLSILLVVRILN